MKHTMLTVAFIVVLLSLMAVGSCLMMEVEDRDARPASRPTPKERAAPKVTLVEWDDKQGKYIERVLPPPTVTEERQP